MSTARRGAARSTVPGLPAAVGGSRAALLPGTATLLSPSPGQQPRPPAWGSGWCLQS